MMGQNNDFTANRSQGPTTGSIEEGSSHPISNTRITNKGPTVSSLRNKSFSQAHTTMDSNRHTALTIHEGDEQITGT